MKQLKEKGQSSIEFILTFTFTLGIFFIFLSLTFNFVSGYVAHYATFYASRVYLTYDNAQDPSSSINQATVKAKEYFESLPLEAFQIPGKTDHLKFNIAGSGIIPEFYGAYFEFSRPLSIYKILTGTSKVNFMSESYLGKEPTREECKRQRCKAMGTSCDGGAPSDFEVTLFDNGC